MFSGIVQTTVPVASYLQSGDTHRLVLSFTDELKSGLEIGASVAIAGVCLTVVAIESEHVSFDISSETLERTTLGSLSAGDLVNVERSIRVGDEIGGHILSGHVVTTGEIIQILDSKFYIQIPKGLMKYVLEKGFIAVDGCSLTVVAPDAETGVFTVALIPETLERTTFGARQVGDKVNVEIDAQTQAIVDTTERVLAAQVDA